MDTAFYLSPRLARESRIGFDLRPNFMANRLSSTNSNGTALRNHDVTTRVDQ